MKVNKQNIIMYLDRRIGLYRRCMVGIFILGLLAGASIVCGKSAFIVQGMSTAEQAEINVFLCFSIALTGIATGSAYRRRIRHLNEHRDRILLYHKRRPAAEKTVRDQIVLEIQGLFAMLFVLAAVICGVQYPIPEIPQLLDNTPMRILLLAGFIILCWVPVIFGTKKPTIKLNPTSQPCIWRIPVIVIH
ncbi:MAG: hypothetical protein P8Z37_14125 [Acidobacteriota bacterium]